VPVVRWPSRRMAPAKEDPRSEAERKTLRLEPESKLAEDTYRVPEEQLAAEQPPSAVQPEAGSSSGRRGLSSLRLLKARDKARRSTAAVGITSSVSNTALTLMVYNAVQRFKRLRTVKVAPVDAPKTLAEARRLLDVSDRNADWEARNVAIGALPDLIAVAADDTDALKEALSAVKEPFVNQLSDLRSAIVRTTCDVLSHLAVTHTAVFAPVAAHVLPQLLNNLALLKVFATPSAAAGRTLLSHAPSTAALRVLVEHSKDSRRQVRLGCMELIGLLVSLADFEIPPKGIGAALGALGQPGRGVSDADGATRSQAAKTFWAAHGRYPGEQVDSWYQKLQEKERKLVDKHRPKAAST